ncbi:hypothetical protein OQA88_11729 [Cercophora sp. LCS_1]
MPPLRHRYSLTKEKFSPFFGPLKSQPYSDAGSTSRGASAASHHSLRSIAWNPLGTLVATGAADKTLRVWNPEKPNVRFSTELKGHASAIEKVAFNPVKDAELASLSNDGVLKIWDVRTKACVNEVKGLGNANALAWAPDGASLLAGNKGSVKSISFTFDGSYIVGGCEDSSGLVVFHTESGDPVHTFKTAGPSEAVAWAPTRYCLAYSDLGILRIVGVDTDRK